MIHSMRITNFDTVRVICFRPNGSRVLGFFPFPSVGITPVACAYDSPVMPNSAPHHRPHRLPGQQHGRALSASARGYGVAWRRLAKWFLQRNPLCNDPFGRHVSDGRTVAAEVVDHIVPRRRGGTDDESNLQALCSRCHSTKTAKYDGGFGNTGMTGGTWIPPSSSTGTMSQRRLFCQGF